jgi:hypothetical protein
VARSEEHSLSGVDLMVIGSAGLAELTPALRKAETRRATQFVKGDERDLETVGKPRRSPKMQR